eukprot:m.227046 g.227046  ORF g.227046 m.227046 type:complete len:69 (+) comp15970_c0_seq4:88-294(+)
MEYDAVIVPGGGLTKDGQPNSFVEARLDSAAQFKGKCKYFILLSRGTPHKPPPTGTYLKILHWKLLKV